ncbi:hypothetical protein FSP39_016248 [Pinctada imbricata]|uniref:Sodium-coupled monocarboxylate transporter 1 n=1 Tax=Pinctada imbricata TaxID=66713 RepID=A0AA88XMR0_PINIB|nr:hypothetical protein FSP39_016248 [Pinctada imbricata]
MARDYVYRFEKGETTFFHWADYLVFGCTVGICAVIGLYHAIRDQRRKKNTTEEFLLAGRKMAVFPVSLSMLGSFISANTLLGTPAEMYNFNTMYWWISVGFIVAIVGATQIFLPIFYNLKVTSVYQITYMAIVLYGPSLALNAGLTLWGSICAVSGVCIFYTALGGMKAVVWTDSFQVLVMIAGMLTLLIEGSVRVGGLDEAWRIADQNKRIKFDDFDPDPTTRHSFWTLGVGGGIFWCTVYGINQAQIQRAMSVPTLKKAKLAMILNIGFLIVLLTLVCAVGVVMYAFYATCDPVKYGVIQKSDQVSLSLWGIIGGPMLGVFCLGILFPWSNKWGAISGQIISLGIMAWIGYGSVFNKVSGAVPSAKTTSGCQDLTSNTSDDEPFPLYKLSYLWYTGLGTLITVVIGLVVSFITGRTDPSTLNPDYICPFFDVFFPCLPKSWRQRLRCNVPDSEEKKEFDSFPQGKDVTVLNIKPLAQSDHKIDNSENQKPKAYKHKPPSHEKKRTPDMGERPGDQEE